MSLTPCAPRAAGLIEDGGVTSSLTPKVFRTVNALPISFFPNGLPRGVANFTVRVGIGPGPGGPFIFNDYYPNVEPDAALASVSLNARQKARNVVTDVAVTVV